MADPFIPSGIDQTGTTAAGGPTGPASVREQSTQQRAVQNRAVDAGFRSNPTMGAEGSGPMPYGMPVNPNYIARIVRDGSMVAKGYLPETFNVSVNSHYDPPFGQGIASQGALGNALKIVGHTTLISQAMTMQVWSGTDPIELQLEMEFLAETDPYQEVLLPIKKLLRLVVPKKTEGVARLEPPGPKINWGEVAAGVGGDILTGISSGGSATAEQMGATLRNAQNSASGKISVFVGNFMTFDNVVITNVTQVYSTMFNDAGLPLKAQVSVAFRTFLVPAISDSPGEDDIVRMFNGPGPGD